MGCATTKMRIKSPKPKQNVEKSFLNIEGALARFWAEGRSTDTNPRVEVMVQFNLALGCMILSLFDC